MVLWEGYKIYFYDSEGGKDYSYKFIKEISIKDPETTNNIINAFFDRIQEGIGVSKEYFKRKIKVLKTNKKIRKLYEFREKSNKLQKLIRIYFCSDDKRKKIVVLHSTFKENKKSQNTDIKIAEKRMLDYFKSGG